MMKLICTLLFALFLPLFSASAQDETAVLPTSTSVDNRLKQFLTDLDTFNADFEQSLFNEFDEELESSSGQVTLMRPGKFYWAYTRPYTQYLVSDGKDLWIYDADLEQVTVSSISNSIEKSPASVLAGETDLDDDYIITDLGTLDGADWVELASADPESQYNSIRIGFNGNELAGMILFDNLGQTTRIIFSNGKRNATVDTTLFDFKPPAGIDIIDNRE
jgi:outer membrane lipoprotein carrier protein